MVLKTPHIYVKSSFMACSNETGLTVLLHPLNLPMAMTFNMSVENWDLDDGHINPVSLDLPNFTQIFMDMPGFDDQSITEGIQLTALAATILAQGMLESSKFD
jgi:hypothetical protein